MANDVTLVRDVTITLADGTQITVSPAKMIITPFGGDNTLFETVIEGDNYDMVKSAIARLVSPESIFGKPLNGIGGDKIYIGMR